MSHIPAINYIQKHFPGGRYLFNGLHPNFSRLWYLKAGISIIVMKAMKIIWPQILNIVFMVPACALKRAVVGKRQLFQSDMNKYYEKLHTNLWDRYANILSNVCYTLMFCSGIPLILPLQAAYNLTQYWLEKLLRTFPLLKLSD